MILLPYLDMKNKLHDGSYVKALTFCKKNYDSGKCKAFYTEITSKGNGFYKCPYGLSACVKDIGDEKIIFMSFRAIGTYTRKNKKFLHEDVYNPILSKEQTEVLIDNSLKERSLYKEIEEKQVSIDSMFHEIRKLNAQIREHCESLFFNYADKNDVYQLTQDEYTKLFEKINTLYVISSMISTRYSLYGYERNPIELTQGNPININVYKKFDKCRRVLKNYQRKNIFINFLGQSYKEIKAYPSFEMIPFLLLENAIKYSIADSDNNDIKVNFSSEQNGELTIEIESYGPYCEQTEIEHIIEKGYRGKNAKKSSDGNGIGLYFIKTLCDIHNIELSFKSDTQKQKDCNGIAYAPFTVSLKIFDMTENE